MRLVDRLWAAGQPLRTSLLVTRGSQVPVQTLAALPHLTAGRWQACLWTGVRTAVVCRSCWSCPGTWTSRGQRPLCKRLEDGGSLLRLVIDQDTMARHLVAVTHLDELMSVYGSVDEARHATG